MNLLSRISLVTGLVIALFFAAGWSRPNDAADEIMPLLGLKSGELITIAQEQVERSEMAITMNGHDYTIDYKYLSNRSKNFRLMVQQENGEIVEQDAPAVSTIRGTLRGVEGSRVVGCVSELGCCAKIQMPTGESCYIEPVNQIIDNPAFAGVHVVYSAEDVIPSEGRCGVETNLAEAEQNFERDASAESNSSLYEAEISVDADTEYFLRFGSTDAALARIELIINIVNDQYESEIGMRHTVSRVMIWRNLDGDPFTESDPDALTLEFQAYYQTGDGNKLAGIDADICHLFTSRSLSGIAIGNAFTGGACGFVAYGFSSHLNQLSEMTDLVAHELGHNWGAGHCTCPNHTMNPSLVEGGANDFNDAITVPVLIARRNALAGSCLDLITPPANDDWDSKTLIPNSNFSVTGSNINATTEADEPDLTRTGSSVWWYLDADETGLLTIDTVGCDFFNKLYVYECVPSGGFADMVLVDYDPSSYRNEVTFVATAGTRYAIRVGGSRFDEIGDGDEGNIVLNGAIRALNPPPPSTGVGIIGPPGTFVFTASGDSLQGGPDPNEPVFERADTYLALFNSSGSLIGENDDAPNTFSSSELTIELDEGVYYLVLGFSVVDDAFFDDGFVIHSVDPSLYVIEFLGYRVGINDRSILTYNDSLTAYPALVNNAAIFQVEVSSVMLGDVNLDGTVNFLDINPFIAVLSTGEFQFEADCNEDGLVNFLDIGPFIAILSGQ